MFHKYTRVEIFDTTAKPEVISQLAEFIYKSTNDRAISESTSTYQSTQSVSFVNYVFQPNLFSHQETDSADRMDNDIDIEVVSVHRAAYQDSVSERSTNFKSTTEITNDLVTNMKILEGEDIDVRAKPDDGKKFYFYPNIDYSQKENVQESNATKYYKLINKWYATTASISSIIPMVTHTAQITSDWFMSVSDEDVPSNTYNFLNDLAQGDNDKAILRQLPKKDTTSRYTTTTTITPSTPGKSRFLNVYQSSYAFSSTSGWYKLQLIMRMIPYLMVMTGIVLFWIFLHARKSRPARIPYKLPMLLVVCIPAMFSASMAIYGIDLSRTGFDKLAQEVMKPETEFFEAMFNNYTRYIGAKIDETLFDLGRIFDRVNRKYRPIRELCKNVEYMNKHLKLCHDIAKYFGNEQTMRVLIKDTTRLYDKLSQGFSNRQYSNMTAFVHERYQYFRISHAFFWFFWLVHISFPAAVIIVKCMQKPLYYFRVPSIILVITVWFMASIVGPLTIAIADFCKDPVENFNEYYYAVSYARFPDMWFDKACSEPGDFGKTFMEPINDRLTAMYGIYTKNLKNEFEHFFVFTLNRTVELVQAMGEGISCVRVKELHEKLNDILENHICNIFFDGFTFQVIGSILAGIFFGLIAIVIMFVSRNFSGGQEVVYPGAPMFKLPKIQRYRFQKSKSKSTPKSKSLTK